MSDYAVSVGNLTIGGNFVAAALFGAFIIVISSYRQLDVPSYQIDERRREILDLATPKSLVGHSAFFRAYLFYLGLLLLFYLILSFFGSSASHLLFPENTVGFPGDTAAGLQIDQAFWPLLVALSMVGLGPTSKTIRGIDEEFRSLAHRLVGIPDNLWDIAGRIAAKDPDSLELKDPARKSAIVEKTETHTALASAFIGSKADALRGRLLWYFVMHSLFLQEARKQNWPSGAVRERFKALEDRVNSDAGSLRKRLESLESRSETARQVRTASEGDTAASAEDRHTPEQLVDEFLASEWDRIYGHLNTISERLSALIALYAVNGKPPPSSINPAIRQTIFQARESRQSPVIDFIVGSLLMIFGGVLVITFFAGILDIANMQVGPEQSRVQLATGLAFTYAFGAIFVYGPASLLGWFIRYHNKKDGNWLIAHETAVAFPTVQYAKIFLSTYIVTVASIFFYNIMVRVYSSADVTTVLSEFVNTPDFVQMFAFAALGGVHASFLCYWLDRWDGDRITAQTKLVGPVVQGGVYAAITTLSYGVKADVLGGLDVVAFEIVFAGAIGYLMGLITLVRLSQFRGVLPAVTETSRPSGSLA